MDHNALEVGQNIDMAIYCHPDVLDMIIESLTLNIDILSQIIRRCKQILVPI